MSIVYRQVEGHAKMRDAQRAFTPRCLEVTCGAVATQASDVCPGAWRCAEHGVFFVTAKTEPEPT